MDMEVPEMKREYLETLMSMFIIRVTKKSYKQELLNSFLLLLIKHEEEQLHWQIILENLLELSHLTLGQLETVPLKLLGLHNID